MMLADYNQKARKELRHALCGAGRTKVAAKRFRDLSRLAARFSGKRGWRSDNPELAGAWAAAISELATEEKHRKRKGRPPGILTFQEKVLADIAVTEVWAEFFSRHGWDEIIAITAPNPYKRGLTKFRQAILDRAMALAEADGYRITRKRMVEEIRNRLQGPQPQINYLASRVAWRAKSPKRT